MVMNGDGWWFPKGSLGHLWVDAAEADLALGSQPWIVPMGSGAVDGCGALLAWAYLVMTHAGGLYRITKIDLPSTKISMPGTATAT